MIAVRGDELEGGMEGECHHCGAVGMVWECLECNLWACRKCRGLVVPEAMTADTEDKTAVICWECMRGEIELEFFCPWDDDEETDIEQKAD